MYDTIVLPTDGSPSTGYVADRAFELAEMADATVHALYVVDEGVESYSKETLGVVKNSLEAVGEEATERVAKQGKKHGIPVVTAIRTGTPHEEILAYAEDLDADVIVMGTHGRTGLNRMILGSVTERVVRISERPVMTVKLPEGKSFIGEDRAKEIATEALESDGQTVESFELPYRDTSTWVIPAETTDGATVNVHVDATTGDARIAHLERK